MHNTGARLLQLHDGAVRLVHVPQQLGTLDGRAWHASCQSFQRGSQSCLEVAVAPA